jgi:hypothetical protein
MHSILLSIPFFYILCKKGRDEVELVNGTIKWKTAPLFASYDLGLTLPPPPCYQREERVREKEKRNSIPALANVCGV